MTRSQGFFAYAHKRVVKEIIGDWVHDNDMPLHLGDPLGREH